MKMGCEFMVFLKFYMNMSALHFIFAARLGSCLMGVGQPVLAGSPSDVEYLGQKLLTFFEHFSGLIVDLPSQIFLYIAVLGDFD